ncbi:hypothetical protein YPPY89_3783, partial [Yersinia pestis PY-89]
KKYYRVSIYYSLSDDYIYLHIISILKIGNNCSCYYL